MLLSVVSYFSQAAVFVSVQITTTANEKCITKSLEIFSYSGIVRRLN